MNTFVVADTSKETLTNLIKVNVSVESEVIADNFPSYTELHKKLINHVIVKKEPYNYVTDTYFHTYNMEGYSI